MLLVSEVSDFMNYLTRVPAWENFSDGVCWRNNSTLGSVFLCHRFTSSRRTGSLYLHSAIKAELDLPWVCKHHVQPCTNSHSTSITFIQYFVCVCVCVCVCVGEFTTYTRMCARPGSYWQLQKFNFRSHCGPGVDFASNRNEYQESFLGLRRPVRRTDNLTTFMCRLSRNSGSSTFWNPKGLSRPVAGKLYIYLLLLK
jgi:hypothetical protein